MNKNLTHVMVSKDDGSIWQYSIEGNNVKGLSKVVLPAHPGSGGCAYFGQGGGILLLDAYRRYATWKFDGKQVGQRSAISSDNHRLQGVSADLRWMALRHEKENRVQLLLYGEQLSEQGAIDLPSRYFDSAVVANDGSHVVVSDSSTKVSYVYRLK